MAPTSTSSSTKGSIATTIASITRIPTAFPSPSATSTYISKGSPIPTNTSLRGSRPPTKMAIQSSTLAFVLVLTLLLGIALGIYAWKKRWSNRKTVVLPLQQPKQAMLQRQESNATLVDESSLRRYRSDRTVRIETIEVCSCADGSVKHMENVVEVPKKAYSRVTTS